MIGVGSSPNFDEDESSLIDCHEINLADRTTIRAIENFVTKAPEMNGGCPFTLEA
jgi:hypothetical protein